MTTRSIHLCGQDIESPGHICAFFSSRDQEYSTLIPYFKQGIDEGELVFNVIDRRREPDHQRRLAAAGLDVTVATSEDTYLADGQFDMERMCDFIRETLVQSAMSGKRVRTAGWMDWIHREAPGTERTMEYEARMNLLVPTFDCTFMCVYDLDKLSGGLVADILATHRYVIMNGQIRRNSFYVEPDVYLNTLVSARKSPSATGA